MMMMMMSSLPQSSWSAPLLPKSKPFNGDFRPMSVPVNYRDMKASAGVPDFFSADWLESRRKKPDGPRLNFSAEEAVEYQLDALKHNANLVKIMELRFMYRDLILTVGQNQFKQRVWVRGNPTEEEEIFQFTMVQTIPSNSLAN
ncbi:hypothetical protein LINPERHAP2_LOCUS27497 [Linum perenne]